MNRRSLIAFIAAICTLIFGVEACSGDDSNGSSASGMEKVSVATTGLNSLHIFMIVARDEKLMKPAGIDLNLVNFNSQGQVVPALLSGSVQFASSSAEQIMAAGQKQPDLKLVVATAAANPYELIGGPGIDSITDLKGKTIGVNAAHASADYFTGKLLLADAGLTEGSDYTFTNTGVTSARVAALDAKQVSAVLLFPPDTIKATSTGNKVLAYASDSSSLQNVCGGGLASLSSWYDKNKDTAARFVRGYQDSIKWIDDPANRKTVVSDIATEMKISQKDAETTYDFFITKLGYYNPTGEISLSGLKKTLANAHTTGIEPLKSLNDSDLSSFYDNSLVTAAKKINE